MKVLVAEDEFTTRLMVQVSLENWGYSVESVVDGKQAWTSLRTKDAPQIAILDWEMPEIDGVELCRMVKELPRNNPIYVILLTARDNRNDILCGFDAGADDYMTKPFNDDELRARVRVAERMVRIQSSLASSLEELRQVVNLIEVQEPVVYCDTCKRIEGQDGLWYSLQSCLTNGNDPRFSPVRCPECGSNDQE